MSNRNQALGVGRRRCLRLRARLVGAAVLSITSAVGALLAAHPAATGASPYAPAQRLAATSPGWVTGTVVDEDGRPVAGAMINILSPEEVPEKALLGEGSDRTTVTDQDGNFRARQHEDGYLVQACEPSPDRPYSCQETALGVNYVITYFGPDGVSDSWLRQTRLFEAGTADHNVGTMTVTPPGQIRGRIAGAEFASITVMRLNDTPAFRTDTDGNGNYTFRGLTEGRYYVNADIGGKLPWRSANVDVVSGKTVRVNGAVSDGAIIKGRLRHRNEHVAGTDVVVARNGQWLAAGTTDARGAFAFSGFLPGRYRIGILYDGGLYRRSSQVVTITRPYETLRVSVTAKAGATLTFVAIEGGKPAKGAVDELRDGRGVPVLKQRNQNGTVTYTGLAPGRYTAVISGKKHFALKKIRIKDIRTYDLGTVPMNRKHLTISGRTAPGAVVEATTGDLCPPGGPGQRTGAFDDFVKADGNGRYKMSGLVPGRYMLGSDGWPGNYAPYCRSNVSIQQDSRFDLPLERGGSVTGRLVYAGTQRPVVTPLSYDLQYAAQSSSNPTDEHPARGKTRGVSGVFHIDGLRVGSAHGRLATETGDDVTDESYFVIYPFQDGTPYWYETPVRDVTIPRGAVDLGDIELTLRGVDAAR